MADESLGNDTEARALLWRCRRGMKELDVLLGRYAAAVLPRAGALERRLLANLLERPDPQLAGYFFGAEVPPEPDLLFWKFKLGLMMNEFRGSTWYTIRIFILWL